MGWGVIDSDDSFLKEGPRVGGFGVVQDKPIKCYENNAMPLESRVEEEEKNRLQKLIWGTKSVALKVFEHLDLAISVAGGYDFSADSNSIFGTFGSYHGIYGPAILAATVISGIRFMPIESRVRDQTMRSQLAVDMIGRNLAAGLGACFIAQRNYISGLALLGAAVVFEHSYYKLIERTREIYLQLRRPRASQW